MTAADRVEALCLAIEAELEALDRDDLDSLTEATRMKLALVEALRDETPPEAHRTLLARARDLNREAGRRVNLARARVEKRMARIATAKGAPPPLTYGPRGRTLG